MIDFIKAVLKATTKEITPLAKERLSTCLDCEEKIESFFSTFVDFKIVESESKGWGCRKCDCPFATKIYATEKENICEKWKK
jgi:hypothetical protein